VLVGRGRNLKVSPAQSGPGVSGYTVTRAPVSESVPFIVVTRSFVGPTHCRTKISRATSHSRSTVLRLAHGNDGIAWLTIGPLQAPRARSRCTGRRAQSPISPPRAAGLFPAAHRKLSALRPTPNLSHSCILLSRQKAIPKTGAIRAIDLSKHGN
jgi:hypothetical protein